MSNKPFSKRSFYTDRFRSYFAPVAKNLPEYHIFRLEGLFQGLHDLWVAGAHKRRDSTEVLSAYRRMQAITGLGSHGDVPPDSWFIMPFLMLGSMICNDALKALQTCYDVGDPGRHNPSSVENYVVQMRSLLITLHDFLEVHAYQNNHPQDHQTVRQELAALLGQRASMNHNELIRISFVTGSEIATAALATLQHARQTAV